MKFAVIVPCYNEEKRLQVETFLSFAHENPHFSFLFTNDGSRDGTLGILNAMAEKAANISVLNLEQNGGKAEAVRRAFLHLKDQAPVDYVAFYDADQATPLYELLRLSKRLEEGKFECLLGTRFRHLGAKIERKVYRHYLGRIFATIVSMMLKLPIYDTQCGCKFFSWKIVQSNIFENKFVSPWFFDVECLFRMKPLGLIVGVVEEPLTEWRDVAGSKLKSTDFLKTPLELLKIYYHYVYQK